MDSGFRQNDDEGDVTRDKLSVSLAEARAHGEVLRDI
jgi:hypothetical protein